MKRNFRTPDPSQENFSRGLDFKRTNKKCSKYKRRFKMQQLQSKIIHKIQNESSNLSFIGAVIEISVASDFTTHQ
jgi:hypothetical protein